jgi:thiol:disulfide interchange protein DsbD
MGETWLRRHAPPGLARGLALAALLAAPAAASPQVPEGAFAAGALEGGEPRVEARLLVHPDDEAAGAASLRVGVLFELDPGWHLYWRNPGESGLATELALEVEGAEVGPLAWPAPEAFEESDGLFTTYGYAGAVLLGAEARLAPPRARPREVRAEARLLVCRVECIPAELSLARRVGAPGAAGAPRDAGADAEVRALFAGAAASLPVAPEALGLELALEVAPAAPRAGESFGAALSVRPCRGGAATGDCAPPRPVPGASAFIPERLEGVELDWLGTRELPGAAGGFQLEFEGQAFEAVDARKARLRGVLAVEAEGGRRHVAVDLPLAPAPGARAGGAPVPAPAAPPALSLGAALLLALLGGLVLNAMPCVLPVLAIKVCALAGLAHGSRRALWHHGLAYAGGIALSMAALAGCVIALRAAGSAVGWGFQFQEPLFLAGVSALLVLLALNLFGVFQVNFHGGALASLGQEAAGARRSFFDGLLAVVLATPCSAPFLGTAVGFAFAAPGPAVLAVFLAIGLGLALPFLAVAASPGWARLLPRPGAWMLKLRAGLGFALLATVVWLLWLLGRSAGGADAVVGLLATLVALGFAGWVYGALQGSPRRPLRAAAGLALVATLALGLNRVRLEEAAAGPGEAAPAPLGQPYRAGAIGSERAAGRPVLAYFTADWCITCKVNEKLVLADERVRGELARLDVAVFRADWTRRDEAIRAELARHGRAGVPLYLVYAPGSAGEPLRLPELLTVQGVVEALRTAAQGGLERG